MVWNPDQYHLFSDHRLRPALDLLSQVHLTTPRVIYDLGCGTGNVTSLLSKRWGDSIIVGVDSSAEMLEKAKNDHPALEWKQADIQHFEPTSKGHLIFSNAALHWLDKHDELIPSLLEQLIPGGVLAVQMPNNFQAPSHQLLYDLALSNGWRDKVGSLVRPAPVHKLEWYYDLLSSKVANLNLWETTYFQVLGGKNAVLEWTRGTALRPFLAALDSDEERNTFEQEYADLLLDAYPQQEDGSTIYPFSRLFIVAETESD
ncbi:methyltransferase domain-containing protein [Sneathiella sp. P13V-1]|uniref:methyltransferase domain-containing protein n=1 Tax=Sneathiella sp. P13V-1 TaxID=2697366 RepID=UPI00187BA46C|nr:methyltransferase domain-containing protein [Sneathiella sp. P13V-1]MBE7635408.1 methyltransferase domain-containing protein [Sneathiella sp. P13V-1]